MASNTKFGSSRSNPPVTKENSPNDGQQEHHHEDTSATNPMTAPAPAAIPRKKCKVDIYSLRTHEVVKTLENFDVDESVEITEIQSNDRVVVLVMTYVQFRQLYSRASPY